MSCTLRVLSPQVHHSPTVTYSPTAHLGVLTREGPKHALKEVLHQATHYFFNSHFTFMQSEHIICKTDKIFLFFPNSIRENSIWENSKRINLRFCHLFSIVQSCKECANLWQHVYKCVERCEAVSMSNICRTGHRTALHKAGRAGRMTHA
jgi:hypothetical protein